MQKTQQLVSKEMTIGDVVTKYPIAADIMLNHGLHCIGCHVNPYESIEMGAKSHGMSDSEVESMLKEVNNRIAGYKDSEGIRLTDFAAKKIKEISEKENKKGYGLRVAVVAGGCAGYQYAMSFENKKGNDDIVIENNGVKLYIDNESSEFLKGSNIDFIEGLQGAGFKINNPNVNKGCGCGKSFS